LNPQDSRFVGARRNREDKPWLEILGPLAHAGSVNNRSPLFVGRRFESFCAELRGRPLTGTSLEQLDATHLQWRDVGAKLGMAGLLAIEGRLREADELMTQAVAQLPPEIRSAFTPATAPIPPAQP
jgi:hypothetical protein